MKNVLCIWLIIVVLLLSAPPIAAHEADPQEAGHPLRVAAYVLHPVGYFLHRMVFEPAHKFVSSPEQAEVFGHRPDIFETGPAEPTPAKSRPMPTPEQERFQEESAEAEQEPHRPRRNFTPRPKIEKE